MKLRSTVAGAIALCVLFCTSLQAETPANGLYKPMEAPFSTWVEAGQARAEIVTDEFEASPGPADYLNEYLDKMTGTPLPVVRNPNPDIPTVFLGPDCGLSRLPGLDSEIGPGGFVIISQGSDLVIAGRDRLATLYGVCAFLEECLGVRWFWDHPTGEVVPSRSTLRIGRVRKVERPDFRIRWVGHGEWALKNRMNVDIGQPDEYGIWRRAHTFLDLVPPSTYLEEHPEYYAMYGGERPDSSMSPEKLRQRRWQLCTSNPDVVDAVAKSIDRIVDANPGINMVTVGPEDSQQFCECPDCRALDETGVPYSREYSRRLLIFLNRIGKKIEKKHPDLLIKGLAYHTYLAPPKDPEVKPRDNVAVQLARFMCHNHPLTDPGCYKNEKFHSILREWEERTDRLFLYEYYWKVSWCHLYWPVVHALKQDLPELRRRGLMGVYTQYTNNFPSNGLAYYVARKMLWDADVEVDALLADFYVKAYGAAREPMQEYHEAIERGAIESGVHLGFQKPYRQILKLFTPALLRQLETHIDRAREMAEDEGAKTRVEMMADQLAYTRKVVHYLETLRGIRQEAPGSRWAGIAEKYVKRAEREAGPEAEAIRTFLKEHRFVGGTSPLNNYIERLTDPGGVLRNWREEGRRKRGHTALTKTQWLVDHPQQISDSVPEKVDLWVYGHDLDYAGGEPEHTLLAETPDGDRVAIGTVATADRPGNRTSRGYRIADVPAHLVHNGTLHLILRNDPGGPYVSNFYAIYVMPAMPSADDGEVTRRIERDLPRVRARSLGFVEFDWHGLPCGEGKSPRVELKVEGLPVPE